MTSQQKYAIATMLATDTLVSVLARLGRLDAETFPVAEALAFARKIGQLYRRPDGFVPRKVAAMCR